MSARTNKTTATTINSDASFQNFLAELIILAEKYADSVPAAKTVADKADAKDTSTKAKASKAKDEEPEDEDDEDETPDYDSMTIAALRKLVLATGEFDAADVKAADKETLIDALTGDADDEEEEDEDESDADDSEDADGDEDGDEEDDEDDEDEEDEEGEEETRDDLMKMTLAALRKKARDEYDATPADIKGLDKDAIIDLILDDADAEEEDDDEDEDDEDGYTADELDAMDLDELTEIFEEWDIDLPKRKTKAALIKGILTAQDEDDE